MNPTKTKIITITQATVAERPCINSLKGSPELSEANTKRYPAYTPTKKMINPKILFILPPSPNLIKYSVKTSLNILLLAI